MIAPTDSAGAVGEADDDDSTSTRTRRRRKAAWKAAWKSRGAGAFAKQACSVSEQCEGKPARVIAKILSNEYYEHITVIKKSLTKMPAELKRIYKWHKSKEQQGRCYSLTLEQTDGIVKHFGELSVGLWLFVPHIAQRRALAARKLVDSVQCDSD